FPDLETNPYAASAKWPAGRIPPRYLMAIPITLDWKLVANFNSSVIVDANRFLGDCCPTFPEAPTVLTLSSCVQYIACPVAWIIQSLPAIPWIEGTEPV